MVSGKELTSGRELTIDDIWALFQETDRLIKEGAKEAERRSQETERFFKELREKTEQTHQKTEQMREETDRIHQETDRQVQEIAQQLRETTQSLRETRQAFQETKRLVDKTSKSVGDLNNRIGEIVEHLMSPDLKAKFNTLGYRFEKTGRDISISDAEGRFVAEVDVLLENSSLVIAVEVKTKLSQNDIDEHANRMEKLRGHANTHNDNRQYLGAVSAAVIKDEVRDYAFKRGFFVIMLSGDTVDIVLPSPNWKPRVW
jgi:F0F1-type ATP synthase membrane subunit b/b'